MSRRKMLTIGSLVLSLLLCLCAVVLLQPEWLVATLRDQSPQVVYSIDTDELVVAITIDDGPDAVQTPKILDLLSQYDAHATFFLITSRIPGNEGIVRRIVDEGHEIGNHMMVDEPSILLTASEFEQQFLNADTALSKFAQVRWFRPGSGWFSEAMITTIQRHGYRCALGSVYPYDPQLGSSWFSAQYILWKTRPGSIIVLHDYQQRGDRSAMALTKILPELQHRGYRMVTLSELVDEYGSKE